MSRVKDEIPPLSTKADRLAEPVLKRFRQSEMTRAIRAAEDAGLKNYDVLIDHNNRPVVRVRHNPAWIDQQSIDDEIAAFIRES